MLRQTLNEISTIVADNRGNISLVQQTADRLATRISNAEGDISAVEQTADKIEWIVGSGTSASNFQLTSRMAKLVAAEVDITGFVTFTDLERKGRTEINGGNITTGTIDADSVTAALNVPAATTGKAQRRVRRCTAVMRTTILSQPAEGCA